MHSSPAVEVKSLLITGGTGFVGRSLLDAFARGLLKPFGVRRVIVVARHARRLRDDAPELCGAAVELVDADVLRLDSTFDADVLLHAAASADAQRYRVDPDGESRIVVEGTRRVCKLISAAKRRPRFLYLSSGAVYGRQPVETAALREDAPMAAEGDPGKASYTKAKRAAEAIVGELAAATRMPTRIARLFAFVGPWLPRDSHFAIGNFIGNALRGEPIAVRARHPVIRSYLHADDLAVWLMRLATAGSDECEIFNVGSSEAVSIRDLALLVAAAGGVGVSLPPPADFEAGRVSEPVDRYVPDVRKARDELGLSVTIPLKEAVDRTLEALSAKAVRRSEKHAGERLRLPR